MDLRAVMSANSSRSREVVKAPSVGGLVVQAACKSPRSICDPRSPNKRCADLVPGCSAQADWWGPSTVALDHYSAQACPSADLTDSGRALVGAQDHRFAWHKRSLVGGL